MVVISHFKLYPALFHLKWLIYKPNISAVQGNVIFETLHDFYRTAIVTFIYPLCNIHSLLTSIYAPFTELFTGSFLTDSLFTPNILSIYLNAYL